MWDKQNLILNVIYSNFCIFLQENFRMIKYQIFEGVHHVKVEKSHCALSQTHEASQFWMLHTKISVVHHVKSEWSWVRYEKRLDFEYHILHILNLTWCVI